MPDPELQRAAEFLAAHALPLLALVLFGTFVLLAAAAWAVSVVLRYKPLLLRGFNLLLQQASGRRTLTSVVARSKVLVPSAYVGLHLAIGLVVAMAVAVFATLAEEIVTGGGMAAFDVAFARALQDTRTPEWDRIFSTISRLGSRDVLTTATVAVAFVLLFSGKIVLTVGWIAAQAGGGLLNAALKETFARTRPEFADPMLAAESWSFPSGHAMGTFILCGVGCYLVARELRSWAAAAGAAGASLAWCVVMAFSRLYLGVHFASDVAAGMAAGLAWVAVCVSALEVVRRPGPTAKPFASGR